MTVSLSVCPEMMKTKMKVIIALLPSKKRWQQKHYPFMHIYKYNASEDDISNNVTQVLQKKRSLQKRIREVSPNENW
jgi:hypothetical protein